MIAFLGTGLMGTGFVERLLSRGEPVTVWNRTAARAEPLAARGARVAPDPATAVRDATRVHLSLLDDAAVDEVIARVRPALPPGCVIVDHTTTAPDPTATRAERLGAEGIAYLHCPVFMGPSNAREGTGILLAAGPRTLFETLRPALAEMTGEVMFVGERPDLAAALKLLGNMMIMFIVSGTAEAIGLARRLEIDPADVLALFGAFHPESQIRGRGRRMISGDVTPAFELSAARKDVRLLLETADRHGAVLPVLAGIARRFDEVIAAGHGSDDLAVIGVGTPTTAPGGRG